MARVTRITAAGMVAAWQLAPQCKLVSENCTAYACYSAATMCCSWAALAAPCLHAALPWRRRACASHHGIARQMGYNFLQQPCHVPLPLSAIYKDGAAEQAQILDLKALPCI